MQHKKPRFARAEPSRLSPDPSDLIRQETAGSRPLYFGPPERPLFGWLHRPERDSLAPVGLIICNPFGNEAVCAQRSIRHFAEEACKIGLPVLRFDYDGTGDSAGQDHDPERLAAWLDSIHSAAEELKQLTGVERICLLGIRLGATLAVTAAAERDDVEALIAIAPVVSGKAYVREFRLLQRAIDAKRNLIRPPEDDNLEAAGFVLSAKTQAAITALDLGKLETVPAPRILVLDRAEMPGDKAWTQRLPERGVHVDRREVHGYTEMMLDSHETVVPHEMIQVICRWLGEMAHQLEATRPPQPHVAATASSSTVPPPSGMTLRPEEMPEPLAEASPEIEIREQAVRFGSAALFGIVSTPETGSPAPSARAQENKGVLFLNAGAVHRIGPNRVYVTLARQLARRGYTVLRMDIAGLGDSPARAGEAENVVYSQHALEDVRAALEYLRREWGVTEVCAAGVCSGAYNSFKAAVAHLPLRGAILINPLTFFWKEGMSLQVGGYTEHRIAHDIQRYRTNVFRFDSWKKLLTGKVDLLSLVRVLATRLHAQALSPLRAVARAFGIPLKDDLPSELRAVARSGIQLNFIFADRDPGRELLNNLGGTTARHLVDKGAIRIQTIEGADHTFTDRSHRAELVTAIVGVLTVPAAVTAPTAEPQPAL